MSLSQKLSCIARSWPSDPFRPNFQLGKFLLALSDHPDLTPSAVRAAELLRNNELQAKYQLSEKTFVPRSKPLHYDQLREGFEKSAQGIARPWWKIFFNVW
ncbi:hypothetical protein BD410DRAFT_819142 [Rickenella mellea]|uniref:Uncharacterized protein n=1 Tax=Rickenella mellea TaxID=50990 RepID=A0A4Y7QIA4_9AGAM|nr:hypothetical protein BD410DRAFT_819142 [Rickenella mellea]